MKKRIYLEAIKDFISHSSLYIKSYLMRLKVKEGTFASNWG